MNQHWNNFLSDSRLGTLGKTEPINPARSSFDADYDRIVFSSAFRRLQDKTQVFPISQSDYARTRLTHSIEVASVGRSLGRIVGSKLAEEDRIKDEAVTDLGAIVAAACLAHDLGNPPFGHSGEAAIQAWAKKEFARTPLSHPYASDFISFEGNAQAFRILTRLQDRSREGGMRLTHAVLGALLKYPTSSTPTPKDYEDHQSFKKWGYFHADADLFEEVVKSVGLKPLGDTGHARHPLAYLVEAADDICYSIVDLEDAYRANILSYEDFRGAFEPLTEDMATIERDYKDKDARVNVIRARVIDKMINECATTFEQNCLEIEHGLFEHDLIGKCDYASAFKELKEIARNEVYTNERILQIEVAGFQALGGLLKMFSEALVREPDNSASKKLQKLLPTEFMCLIPEDTNYVSHSKDEVIKRFLEKPNYEKYLAVTDYISGMTDGFAVDLFQKLSGIKLT